MKGSLNKKFSKGFLTTFIPGKGKGGQPLGYVEEIGADIISGWAFHPKDSRIALQLKMGNETIDLQPQWVERHDVAATHGMRAINSGFIFFPDRATSDRLASALDSNQAVSIFANNLMLPAHKGLRKGRREAQQQWPADAKEQDYRVADIPSAVAATIAARTDDPLDDPSEVAWKPLNIVVNAGNVRSCIDSWGGFSLRGWAVIGDRAPGAFTLVVSGTEHAVRAIQHERKDIVERHAASGRIGFEIPLPGYLWEGVAADADLSFSLMADGEVLTPRPVTLTRAQAARWIAEAVKMPEGDACQYRMLLACEHLRFGALASHLDAAGKTAFRDFAKRMHLENYLPDMRESAEPAAPTAPEDVNSLLLWAVMRELNASMSAAGGSTFDHIRDNSSWRSLPAQAKEWYLNLAVQLTCESGEFLRLRELTDFTMFQKYEWSEDSGQLTLALPALVAEQHIARATDLMWRLTKKVNSGGWIYTENIRFSVDHLQRLEGAGDVDFALAEKFRYAYIWLLDCFKGEWFSRLHDVNLIDALVSMLADATRYTDNHKRDIVTAAIRHYGLCPTFWDRLDARVPVLQDHELVHARATWEGIRDQLSMAAKPTCEQLSDLLDKIDYFRTKGNPESAIFLRELVANNLESINLDPQRSGRPLLKALLGVDQTEALRIAAFPLAEENRVQRDFLETGAHFGQIVRQMTEGPKSTVYDLQLFAAQGLHQAQLAAHAGDRAELTKALANLESAAIALANWQGGFLVADLLAAAYVMAAQSGLDDKRFLMRIGNIVKKAAYETNADYYLPASVYSALARLAALPANPMLQSFLTEAKDVIEAKFGNRHGALLARRPDKNGIAHASGWPTDTIVVIDSSRDRLGTYVAAIRKTWMQDLNARGIPCIIAIEGEQTAIERFRYADVLMLGPDRNATGPTKTLRLLDWIYENTNAQFVVKIEDDCYLNVERYFDTLTYRKHMYSGRVIRRGAGGFERHGHQKRARNPHARNSLDKSIDRSIYADGAGAVSFSRLALQKLREAQESEEGSRLVASSFVEDKLVGDLLAMHNIYPSNEDCEHVHRHRTFENAVPVAFEENGFLPCGKIPAKVVHLDRADDFTTARDRAGFQEIWPKKIWPSCWNPSIKVDSNQLELLSPPTDLKRLLTNDLVVVAVVRNEMIMMPHFLEHYRKLGVKCFIFVDNCSDDGTREYLLAQPDAAVYSVETAYRHSHYGVAWQQAVISNHCLGKWVVLADADEFLVYEGCETKNLRGLIREVEQTDSDAVFVHMIDMYPFGDLDEASFEKGDPFAVAPWFDKAAQIELKFGGGHFSNSRNLVNGLRHRLAPSRINSYVSQKYALFRYMPWIRLTEGIHYSGNLRVAPKPAYFAHFKYHAGFKSKVMNEIKRNQHYNGAEEYRRYAGMLAEGKGCFGTEELSVRYEGSNSFIELFK